MQGERAQIAARVGEVASDVDPGVVREVVLERVRQMRAAFDGFDADRRVESDTRGLEKTERFFARAGSSGRSPIIPSR